MGAGDPNICFIELFSMLLVVDGYPDPAQMLPLMDLGLQKSPWATGIQICQIALVCVRHEMLNSVTMDLMRNLSLAENRLGVAT